MGRSKQTTCVTERQTGVTVKMRGVETGRVDRFEYLGSIQGNRQSTKEKTAATLAECQGVTERWQHE